MRHHRDDPSPETFAGRLVDGTITFKGIPYAAPPFGANRLRPPQPVDALERRA